MDTSMLPKATTYIVAKNFNAEKRPLRAVWKMDLFYLIPNTQADLKVSPSNSKLPVEDVQESEPNPPPNQMILKWK